MKGKNIKVSLFNLIVHEVIVSCRKLHLNGKTSDEIQDALGRQLSKDFKILSTYGLAFVVCAILIAGGGVLDHFVIKLGTVELKLPTIYLSFAASSCFAIVMLRFLKAIVALYARETLPIMYFGRSRFSGARRALWGDEDFDVLLPIRHGHFVKRTGFVLWALTASLLAMLGALIFPLTGAYSLVWKTNLLAVKGSTEVYLSASIGCVSLALLTMPIVFSILFFIPSKAKKDTDTIRWNFLVHATRQGRRLHPQAERWLSDK